MCIGLLSGCAASDTAKPDTVTSPTHQAVAGETSAPEGTDVGQALEKFVDSERGQIPAIMAANSGVYSDMKVESMEPGSVLYTYTYAAQTDAVAAASYFETMVPTIQTACDTVVFPAMRTAGIEGAISVGYTYLNADGSEIWKKSFESS